MSKRTFLPPRNPPLQTPHTITKPPLCSTQLIEGSVQVFELFI